MKLKNAILTFISLSLILMLSACNFSKPVDMSDQAYTAGVKVLEITDNYLDFEISREEAHEQISELSERFSTDDTDTIDSTLVDTYLSSLSLKLQIKSDDSEILDTRNKLANILNVSEKTN